MVSTAGAIVIAIVVLLIAAAIGWVVFTQLRARRLGVGSLLTLCSPPHLGAGKPFPASFVPTLSWTAELDT